MKSGQRLRLDLELAEHHKSNQNRVVRRDDFDVSGALRDVLQAAKEQDRIICGIYESAEKLRSEPESLMMCILPCMTNCSDIVLQIHLTLIKAFCLEQDIKLIQIDDTEQLRNIISGTNCNHSRTGNDVTDESTDFNCVLIQHPIDLLSDAESRVLNFHAATFDLSPQPVVRLHTDAGPDRLNCISENAGGHSSGFSENSHEVPSPFSWPSAINPHQSIIVDPTSKFVSPAVPHRWTKEVS